jgi:hypothetical protein
VLVAVLAARLLFVDNDVHPMTRGALAVMIATSAVALGMALVGVTRVPPPR